MNLVTRTALGAALALCGALVASPALAQTAAPGTAAPARKFSFSKPEEDALFKLQEAIKTKDAAQIEAALVAARTAAVGTDAKYALATLELQLSRDSGDTAKQAAAVDALIASGGVPAADLPVLLKFQVNAALDRKDIAKAEAGMSRLLEINPNDPQVVMSLGRLRTGQQRYAEALPLFEKAMSLQQASGQPIDETLYRLALNSAYRAKLAPKSAQLSKQLVSAYPTADNWRSALLIYREFNQPEKAIELDALRLMRFTKSIKDERDVVIYADALNRAGLPGEAKALIDEVTGSSLVKRTAVIGQLQQAAAAKVAEDRSGLPALERSALAAANGSPALGTADAYFGYGDYAKAVTLYKAALQKGGVDAGLVNTRLGMALALAGQKAEAEAAFKAIDGPRAELASLLQLWLSKRA
jgi:tetratricopeptide (TPR) repeat protein